jgi:hypothetical protein
MDRPDEARYPDSWLAIQRRQDGDGLRAKGLYSGGRRHQQRRQAIMIGLHELNIQEFEEVLAEAVVWCALRASLQDPCKSLRTLPLPAGQTFRCLSSALRAACVADLIEERRFRIWASGGLNDTVKSPHDGRLRLFYPDESLFDGAAEVASRGFFDADNVPAWDTWVYYGTDGPGSTTDCDQRFLVSWIPREFVPLVNDGIEVNPESCIEWASATDRIFTRSLKAEGMLY